jgi:hypothetical protein
MPETDTTVIERTPDPGAPAAPSGPPAGGFSELAGRIYGAEQSWEEAAGRVREGLKRKAEAVEPILGAAEKELRAPRPMPPPPPTFTPPPSRQLTEFMAPVEGEHPAVSITKLLQAVGLFATGVSGAARGDARVGLAAFTGAMQGWQAGDKERADRHFADWEAHTTTALEKWKAERQTYQDIMEAANLSLDQKMKLVQLAALREDNKVMADVAEKKDLESLIGFLGQQQTHADNLLNARIKIADSREQFNRRQEEVERYHRAMEEAKKDAMEARAREQKEKIARQEEQDQDIINSYSPEALRQMGQKWLLENKQPSIGYGGKRAVAIIRGKAMDAGIEWAKENGIPLDSMPGVRAEYASAKSALTKLRGVNAVQMASIRRFDGHLDALIRLSEKTARSKSPLANRYYLYSRGEIAGDPDVKAFETQAFEVAMEFSRVVVGTAQGDAMTRDEARKNISSALNHEQLVAVGEQLRQNAHRNIETNAASEKALTDTIEKMGENFRKSTMPAAPPLANDPLGIRR